MAWLIDTAVAIHLRDGDPEILGRVAKQEEAPALSLVSLVELRGGAAARTSEGARRRERLAVLLRTIDVIAFDRSVVDAYADILTACGFSRARTLDRLIAATALVHDLTLVTINGNDFRDIPGLKLEVWPAPAQ